MTEQAYMSKENYDRLTLLDPRTLSEEEKKEMYAYTVFNMIANIALAKQRGSEIEKNGMAKQLLTLPNQILKFIADSMIEKMKTTPPVIVRVTIDETFINEFTGMGKKFFAKNPHLISVLKMDFRWRKVFKHRKPDRKLNTIEVEIEQYSDSHKYDDTIQDSNPHKYDYEEYTIAIKNFLIDIIWEKNLLIDEIVFDYMI
jgi:hypothetical protein